MKSSRFLSTIAAIWVTTAVIGSAPEPVLADTLGPQLLSDGAMEAPSRWRSVAPAGAVAVPRIEISAAEKHSGRSSLHASVRTKPGQPTAVVSPMFRTETGKTYQVRFWLKVNKGAVATFMCNGADHQDTVFFYENVNRSVWTEYTAYYTERKGGTKAALRFAGKGFEFDFYLDDVSVREIDDAPATITAQWKKAVPGAQYVCWQKSSPWVGLRQRQSPPPGVRENRNIRVAMGQNEYESASFVLTNLSDKETEFHLSAEDSRIPLTLRQGYWVIDYNGNAVNDALPLLRQKLVVPPGESREIWMTLHSRGIAAGKYHSKVKIVAAGQPGRTVDVNARVYPVALPDKKPISTFYWDFTVPSWMKPEKARAIVTDLKNHHCTVATVHPWAVPRLQVDAAGKLKTDYTELDSTLENYKILDPQMFLFIWNRPGYFVGGAGQESPARKAALPPYMSAEWKVLFKAWLTDWVRHMKEKGYGYDRFAMCADDENILPDASEMAKLIKETDPNILIYVNSFGDNMEQAISIAPYIDIWGPYLYDYLNIPPYEQDPERTAMKGPDGTQTRLLKKSDKYFWTYANPDGQEAQQAPAYSDYRLAVWRAWNGGMSGFGYWVYSYKTSWNNEHFEEGPNWAVVYLNDAKDAPSWLGKDEFVVPGKRWEATREGVEDYVYLTMLKEAVGKAGRNSGAHLQARQLLTDLPAKVIGGPLNERLADQGKEMVLKELTRIGKDVNP